MHQLQKALQQNWLNEKESSVYLSCLQFGNSSPSTLARMTWIPRASIYDIARKLIKSGYLTQAKNKWKTNYVAVEPHLIYIMLNERKNMLEEQVGVFKNMLPEFEKVKEFTWTVPQVQYYEGKDALEFFFNQIAQAKYSYSIFSLDDLLRHVYYDVDHIFEKLSHQHVKWAKRIMSYSPSAQKYINKQTNEHIERKLLPRWYDMEAEITLFDGILLQMSFGDNPTILEIKHPIYYKAYRTLFEYIRNTL